jgi:hypothetical protein
MLNVAGATVKSTKSLSDPVDADWLGRSWEVLVATEICRVLGYERSVLVRTDIN